MQVRCLLMLLFAFEGNVVLASSPVLDQSVQSKAENPSDDEWSFDESPLAEDELDNVYDPLEPFNRLMFKVNNALDKVFLIPLSMTYKHILPNFLQIGIANFASNFFSPIDFINFVL